jgi:transcriptional regulator NrdR family protein
MVCIYCGSNTSVSNSRFLKQSNQVWRRRLCGKCQAIFTTKESVELSGAVMVSKPRGDLIKFSRDHLFISIHESCKHRKGAIDDATALTQTIISKLSTGMEKGVISISDIKIVTLSVLQNFDTTAAAVYTGLHPR